jgi:uncharacterized protein
MHGSMFKITFLLLFSTALAGCGNLSHRETPDFSLVGLRCMMIVGEKPFKQENLIYIERHADYGNAACKTMLGKLYKEGGHGVDQDFTKARALFVEAAKLSPSTNILLGQMAERGEGEPVDYAKAREFYRLSGTNAALPLGRLMEEGKGGPQDLPGALALYLDSAEYLGDEPWKAMNRLRKAGLPLNEVQTKRYQQLWLRSFLREQSRRLRVREVFEAVNATGARKEVTLSYRFKADSGVPQVKMTKGSGNDDVDRWIMAAAQRITLGDSAPLTDSSGVLDIQAPLIFAPLDIRRMRGICGLKPCS